jgi:hypothetical protein
VRVWGKWPANLPQPPPQTNRGIRSLLTVAALRSAPKTVPTYSQQIYQSTTPVYSSVVCLFTPLFQSHFGRLWSASHHHQKGFASNKIVRFVARTIIQ